MPPEQLVKECFGRLSEARMCIEQGQVDGTVEIVQGILGEIEAEDFPDTAKEEIRSCAESLLDSLDTQWDANFFAGGDSASRHSDSGGTPAGGDSASRHSDSGGTPDGGDSASRHSDSGGTPDGGDSASRSRGARDDTPDGTPACDTPAADAVQLYNYGLALIDGQFWEEAIQELSLAAGLGFEPLECRELCGDCAVKLEKWQEAFQYYQCVYSDESLGEEQKKAILAKITKCSQEQKKELAGASTPAKTGAELRGTSESSPPPVFTLDSYLADSVIGRTVTSWTDSAGNSLSGCVHSYKVTDLLYVGSSSLIVELQEQNDGRKFAGQALIGGLKDALPVERLSAWAKRQMLINSRHLVRVYDLANLEGHVFVVREHLPLSLGDLLSEGSGLPVFLAAKLGHQMLEALGDLHLHMGADGTIRNIFHLDLRPSRILLAREKPRLKIYNGGLWKEIEKAAPAKTALRELPLAHLSYRAPEQFRVYLARKKPPVFTDIYLFGALLYEMLTGVPAFKASSFEEYEIQHCEQYPTPPRVWRPEIPETLNDIVMNCLAFDPMKRFRSTTQISLALEKSFSTAVSRAGDDVYQKYLEKSGI